MKIRFASVFPGYIITGKSTCRVVETIGSQGEDVFREKNDVIHTGEKEKFNNDNYSKKGVKEISPRDLQWNLNELQFYWEKKQQIDTNLQFPGRWWRKKRRTQCIVWPVNSRSRL